jgi:hypothetical protein
MLTAHRADRTFWLMPTIRVSGTSLKKARTTLLGLSLQELAARSGVNWLTVKKYEGAGVRFDADGAHLDRAPTMKAQVANPSALRCLYESTNRTGKVTLQLITAADG